MSHPNTYGNGSYERGKKYSNIAEHYAEEKYGLKINQENTIDDVNNRVEVKSCQLVLKDYYDKSILRKGTIRLRKKQHQELASRKGKYIFILMIFENVIADTSVRAKTLENQIIWDIYDECAISWDEIFGYKGIAKILKELAPVEVPREGNFARKMRRHLNTTTLPQGVKF